MRPDVSTLTPDEAVAELEALMDARMEVENDPIALHHWKSENAQRALDLEMWVLIHPPKTGTEPQKAPPRTYNCNLNPLPWRNP